MLGTENSSTSMPIIGDYIRGGQIGSGGFGKVYRAQHKVLGTEACIKVIQAGPQSDELTRALIHEARVLNSLRHEHIVHLQALTPQGGEIYMIMDYIDGGDLSKALRDAPGPFPVEEVDKIIQQISEGLNYAHQKKIIHRDLKLSNILRTKDGRVVIADFGLARIRDAAQQTQTHQSLLDAAGTPPYMPPEHFAGKAEYRSDLYSLGVITYYLLAKRLPFTENFRESHCNQPPPPLRNFNPEITPEIEAVVLKMLAKKPDDRYQSALEFKRALHTAIVKKDVKQHANPETLKQIITAAPAHQAIVLEPGEYKGPFTLSKPVRLIGTDQSTKIYTVDEPALYITTSGVQLENLIIQRARESLEEAVIQADKLLSYTLRHVIVAGGKAEGAQWEDVAWQLPVHGIDFGRIPIESQQVRSVPIEVKEWCTTQTEAQGLAIFPLRLSPGAHSLKLVFHPGGRLAGTRLEEKIVLQGESETHEIPVTGHIEQPVLTSTPEEAPPLTKMEWVYQLQEKAARDLIGEFGDAEQKTLLRAGKSNRPTQLQLRQEILDTGADLLIELLDNIPRYWYVRRYKIDKQNQEEEVWELTLATDRDTSLEGLGAKKKTLRLMCSVQREGRGKLRITSVFFPPAVEGVPSLVSLLALVHLTSYRRGYKGIDQDFMQQIQELPIESPHELDADQHRAWKALLQLQRDLIKKRQYWVGYTTHEYREGVKKIVFSLDKADVKDGDREALAYEEFQVRARNSRKEQLSLFIEIPETTNSRRRYGKEIGTLEQFNAEAGTMTLSLLAKNESKIPPTGYLHFDARGDMSQIDKQEEAITDLEEGKTVNPLLSDFFFDPQKARPAQAIQRLEPADLLSGTCNDGQITAIELALASPDLLLIQGPPGTGKTTVIAEICYQVARQGGRALIASQSNLAVDNALGRLIHHPSIRALRKGNPESVEDEGRDFTEERVVRTWLSNTARDCQTRLEKRRKNIVVYRRLLDGAQRFSRYRELEVQWKRTHTLQQYQLDQAIERLKTLEASIRQGRTDEKKYTPLHKDLHMLVTGAIDWQQPGINTTLGSIFQHITERVDRRDFIQRINTCLELARQLDLAPPENAHLLRNIVWLHEALPTHISAWRWCKDLIQQTEEKFKRLDKANQQHEQATLSRQDKQQQLQQLGPQIESLRQILQQRGNTLRTIQIATNSFNTLPQKGPGSLATTLHAFFQAEIRNQRQHPGVQNTLRLGNTFPPKIIQILQGPSAQTFIQKWESALKDLRVRIEVSIKEMAPYDQVAAQIQHYQNIWRQEAPSDILQEIKNIPPRLTPQSMNEINRDCSIIEHNLSQIQQLRTHPSSLLGTFFTDKEKRIRGLLWGTYALLNSTSNGLQAMRARAQTNLESTNITFITNIANALSSSLGRLLEEQQRQAQAAYDDTLNQINQLETRRQEVQHDLEAEDARVATARQSIDTHTQQLADAFLQLSISRGLPATLCQLAQQNALPGISISASFQEYRDLSAKWISDTQQLEMLVAQLWNDLTAAAAHMKEQLSRTQAELEGQRRTQQELIAEKETLEQALKEKPADLMEERQWWVTLWQTIPETLRPTLPSEGLFALTLLDTIQQQFTDWRHELEKEESFAQKYDGLIGDWVNALQYIPEYDKEELKKLYTKNANVIGITCGQAPRMFARDYGAFSNFNAVIIDEVSKATPPELLLPAVRGKKVILIGDQHQLPPMIDDKTLEQLAEESGKDPSAFQFLNRSYFEQNYLKAPDALKSMLYVQYRMHPDIMAAINQFYERPLECGLSQPDIERDHQLNSPLLQKGKHLIWVTTPLVSSQGRNRRSRDIVARNKTTGREVFNFQSACSSFGEERRGTSYVNEREVEIIKNICEDLQRIWKPKRDAGIKPKEIGVITFYAAQSTLLRESLLAHRGRKKTFDALNIRVGTVDRFQGMEREVIIVSMVRNNSIDDIGFAKKNERINVAFSRAQQLLIIVGCHDLFCQTNREPDAAERYSNVSKIVKHRGDIIDISCI